MEDLILQYVILYAPALLTVATVLAGVVKFIKTIKALKKDIENNELNAKCAKILEENYELKKTLKKVIAKLDKVKSNDKDLQD